MSNAPRPVRERKRGTELPAGTSIVSTSTMCSSARAGPANQPTPALAQRRLCHVENFFHLGVPRLRLLPNSASCRMPSASAVRDLPTNEVTGKLFTFIRKLIVRWHVPATGSGMCSEVYIYIVYLQRIMHYSFYYLFLCNLILVNTIVSVHHSVHWQTVFVSVLPRSRNRMFTRGDAL